MNHGFDQATAQYVSLLGSDDELEPGAIDSWLSVSRRTDADAVLARIRLADGRTDPYPPVRLCRHTLRLSGEADRLAYRSAPLGLVSRQRFHHLRLTEGLRSGEDLAYSLTVWFTGHHLAYDLRGPAYIVHGDAEDRVTSAVRPLSEDFAFLDALERMSWFGNTTSKVRRAVVVKLIRMHYFDSLRVHLSSEHELSSVQADFLRLLTQLELLAPGVEPLLSIADRRLLDALAAPTTSTDELLRLLNDRQNFPSMATLLPRNPFLLLHRQAPFRTLFAGAVNMRAKRRA